MSRQTKLVKNTLVLSIGTFFPKLVSVITLPILSGYLTKSEYGTYDLITTLASLLLPIVTLQIQSAAFRFLIECRDNRKEIDSIVTNIMLFTIPVSLVTLVILFIVLPGTVTGTKLLICIYYFLDIIYVALQQITRGLSFNMSYSISAIVLSSVNLVLTVLLVWWSSLGINGVLIALIVAYFFGCCFLIFKIRNYVSIKISYFSKRQLKTLLSYSWPMVFNNLSSWILRLSDRVVITAFLGIEANAVYAIANKIPNLLSMVQNTFTMAWQENASLVSKDDDANLYYTYISDNMYCIISGFTALLIAGTPILFSILIRGDYNDAYYQMPLLFLGMMFCCLSAFQGGIYVAYKQTKQVGITTILAAICNLIIDLLFVKLIGITAGSLSTLISYLLLWIFRIYDLKKIVEIKYNFKKMITIIGILIIMCIICYKRILILNIINFFGGILFCFIINKSLIRSIWINVKKKIIQK